VLKGAGGRAEQSSDAHTLSIEQWIARLRLIPENVRSFDVDPRQAKLVFGIDVDLARELISRGLPHAMNGGSPHFTATDLHYIGLRLGCATTHLGVLHTWACSLHAAGDGKWNTVEVLCAPQAPPSTVVQVLVGPDRYVRTSVGADRMAASIRVAPLMQWPAPGPALEDLLTDVASMDFCWLPEPLNGDVEFTRQTRLSDCGNAALFLSRECTRLGIASRIAYGLLLATPLSTPHSWVEVRIDDRWVPVDPLLLGLLARYTTLDASVWPPTRSPGAMLLRLADRETAIVLAGGRPLQASFLTRSL
jgi:hypothetical protein